MGRQGPDQGYALLLARRFADRLELAPDEHAEDAVAGCMVVAMARASLFGRAPVIHDLDLAFTLWGYLGGAPPELVDLPGAPVLGGVAPLLGPAPDRRQGPRVDAADDAGPGPPEALRLAQPAHRLTASVDPAAVADGDRGRAAGGGHAGAGRGLEGAT